MSAVEPVGGASASSFKIMQFGSCLGFGCAFWLDLLNLTSDEVTNVEKTIGATLPSLGALSEIETSSRLSADSVYLIQGALLAQENMTNIQNLWPRLGT